MAHAKLSASGSERWLKCPGSVQAETNYKDSSSVFAQEGTCAHELAEIALNRGFSAFATEDKPLIENNAFTVTREMCEYVQEYVDYVNSFPGEHYIEQRVSYSNWVPEGFGTSDAIIIQDDGTLRVIDLKYGKGVLVDAENNTQGMLYALGAYSEFNFVHNIDRVIISIVQPRLDHISEWEITIDELLTWAEWVKDRAKLTTQPNADRVPGEKQCMFCKAKHDCKALYDFTANIIASDFETFSDELTDTSTLSDEQRRLVLDNKRLIIGWLDAVENSVKDRLESGDVFEGYKLVAGRSSRSWIDEQQAERVLIEALGDKAHEKNLLSVAKAEKALGKKNLNVIQNLIVKSDGKPTLAPSSDKRAAIGANLEDFDCLSVDQ